MIDEATEQANEARRTALGTLLIERGFLDQERLDEGLRIGGETGERLGEVIVRLGWMSEDALAKVLAEQWSLRYFERSAISFDGKALRRMSREDAARLEALPIQESEDGVVVVAIAEPTDARLHALRTLLGDRIDVVVVAKTAIEAGLRSELLAKNGADSEGQFEAPAEVQFEAQESRVLELVPAVAGETSGPAEAHFDEVAGTLTDALAARLAELRGIVVEAESKREQDAREIERLEAELADRSEAIRTMQQTLRGYADALDAGD